MWRLFVREREPSRAAKDHFLPKIAEWCWIAASPAPRWLTNWFIQSLLWVIGPSKLSSIISRWDDEPYFILIQAFTAVIQGKDHLPVTQRGSYLWPTVTQTLTHWHKYCKEEHFAYHSGCPICGVCLTSTLPRWRHPIRSLVTWPSSSPTAPHQGRTRIRIPLTLKIMAADTHREQGCNLFTWHL